MNKIGTFFNIASICVSSLGLGIAIHLNQTLYIFLHLGVILVNLLLLKVKSTYESN